MRWSKYFIPTLREDPKAAEVTSHKLMLRAGLIQKLAGGLYSYLPLGLRVINKVSRIVRRELNKRGALELLMPVLQPKEIWEKSGRWETMGPLMMRFTNREEKCFVLGPTHEEIITGIVAKSIRSYRDLPKNFYQIQTKFRDEIRPRFGVIRAREFIMKDGYSFHATEESADREYEIMYQAYSDIFKRCGLEARPIEADTGIMGGRQSHEFTVPAAAGEDIIVSCSKCGYSANVELASRRMAPDRTEKQTILKMEEVNTPDMKKVDDLARFFRCGSDRFIKTLIYEANGKPVVVLARGDIDISEAKLRMVLGAGDAVLAGDRVIEGVTGAPVGFAGPAGLAGIEIIADQSIQGLVNAITGANKKDKHIKNVNIEKDFKVDRFVDIGIAREGDLCRQCGEELKLSPGIEVGQVFKLGKKYSEKLGAVYLDKKGNINPMIMGCYGIGISRTVAAIVECHNDKNGIKWPVSVAPFKVLIIAINYNKPEIKEASDSIYNNLEKEGIEVLFDDREETAGIKFKDGDLVGIPFQVVVGKKYLVSGMIEIKKRADGCSEQVSIESVVPEIRKRIGQ